MSDDNVVGHRLDPKVLNIFYCSDGVSLFSSAAQGRDERRILQGPPAGSNFSPTPFSSTTVRNLNALDSILKAYRCLR